jgi:hypothetical protein
MFLQHNGIIRRDIQKSNFNLKIKFKKLLLEYYLDSFALVLENNKLRELQDLYLYLEFCRTWF